MSIAVVHEPRIVSLDVTDEAIVVRLADGRIISTPLAWSWRLANATAAQRKRFEIIGSGEGVRWPELDEDLSARGMLQGIPASPPAVRTKTQARRRTPARPRR
jgi:hypothetical protein